MVVSLAAGLECFEFGQEFLGVGVCLGGTRFELRRLTTKLICSGSFKEGNAIVQGLDIAGGEPRSTGFGDSCCWLCDLHVGISGLVIGNVVFGAVEIVGFCTRREVIGLCVRIGSLNTRGFANTSLPDGL